MRRYVVVLSILALMFGLALPGATSAQSGNARVRVVHASPNAPAVDVYVNGTRAFSNVSFFTASGYVSLPAGTARVQVTVAGAPLSTAVLDQPLTVTADTAYTIAATGLLANLQASVFEDDLAPPTVGRAKVRVYHFSPDAPNVDVSLPDNTDLVSNLPFRQASSYLQVISGTYSLKVTPAGSTTTVIDLPNTRLEAGKTYSVFAIGQATSTPATLRAELVVNQFAPTATAQVRVIHASPDAPNVDVYVDGAQVLANVPFFTASNYLTVPAGNRLVQVTAAGQPIDSAVISGTINLAANNAFTLAATGTLATGDQAAFGPTLITDTLTLPTNNRAAVRVYHFSPDAPAVDVSLPNNTDLISNLPFGSASSYLQVISGTYSLKVTPAGGTATVIDLPNTQLEAGKIYSVFAIGLATATPPTIRAQVAVNEFARVRVVHAAPDAPNVDVYVDGVPALANVPFGTISNYLPLGAGARLLQVTPAGSGDLLTSVISQSVTLPANGVFTVGATGTISPTDSAPFGPTIIPDNLSTPPIGQAKVRVYHFSPDAPAVDVSLPDNTDLVSNLPFRQASSYLNVPANSYNLKVTPAGGTATVIDLPNTALQTGQIYSVFALGSVGSEPRIRAGVATNQPDNPFPRLFLPVIGR